MTQPVTLTTRTLSTSDKVALITIDNPPVNALSPGVPEGILTALETAEQDSAVRAIVMICAGRTFISGADIKELEEAARNPASGGPDLHPLLARIEDCAKPVIMAIHGMAFGGGLEVAMAGHYRVAVADASAGRARGQSRHHSGRRRNAAVAAPGGRSRGGGDVRLGKTRSRLRKRCRWDSSIAWSRQ